jgi:hypothetical protein
VPHGQALLAMGRFSFVLVGDLNLLLKIIDRFQIVLYNWGTAKI